MSGGKEEVDLDVGVCVTGQVNPRTFLDGSDDCCLVCRVSGQVRHQGRGAAGFLGIGAGQDWFVTRFLEETGYIGGLALGCGEVGQMQVVLEGARWCRVSNDQIVDRCHGRELLLTSLSSSLFYTSLFYASLSYASHPSTTNPSWYTDPCFIRTPSAGPCCLSILAC